MAAKGTISIENRVSTRGMSSSSQDRTARRLADYEGRLREGWEIKLAELRKKQATASQKQQEKIEKKIQQDQLKHAEILAKYKRELEKQANEEALQDAKELEDNISNLRIKHMNQAGEALGKKLNQVAAVQTLVKGLNALGGSVEKYLDVYTRYMSSVNTRLQGSGMTYESLNKTISKNTALNPYIKYTAALEKMSNLVSLGIASNLTQRAFLATISDKIATTFDVAQSSLLEIVRIQQRDSTAARLGMEAELTDLFNYYFSDTSYLSEVYDTVQATLIGVSSQLSREASIELEYQAQKWLGALGSVGVNSSTLQSIAQGINYLGTGDYESLANNSSLQNLLVLSANRVGLDYSSMLDQGINAEQVNRLMQGIISYVQEIAAQPSNVVKKQYAQLFGLTMSDIAAFQNISDDVIGQLAKTAMTYTDTLSELNNQLDQVGSRMHLSEKIGNVMENILAGTGMGVANNQVLYGIYKSADFLESITGGIKLPFISALGTGVDLNMSLEGLAKAGVIGWSTVTSLLSGISNIRNGGMLNYESWVTDVNKGGFSAYQNLDGLQVSKSSTNYITSNNSLGMQQSLADTQKASGNEVLGSEENQEDSAITILRALKDYFEGGGSEAIPLRVRIQDIDATLTDQIPFYGVGRS